MSNLNKPVLTFLCEYFKADARGGKVLTLLHEQMLSSIGDSKAQTLFLSLTQAATVPYMNILEKWIYKGVICDPVKEVSTLFIFLHIVVTKLVGYRNLKLKLYISNFLRFLNYFAD